ncbi:peptide chain release factor 3 [Auraticoccus monumenti]|uniref:Bacterial peptide chain release factor 3 (BRF-3) n=1 Tax=Auraticoccus monumenti TaxID=675864 RepID=A0A1G6VRA5_9ACTN|nr:peptide chain release factor 3 [Auraticoccus monumenti]SDD55376.1 bacterial peptide chain release factor 3 (bRF-3) [Auraticoccus monumenti]
MSTPDLAAPAPSDQVVVDAAPSEHAARRRTVAIISHPDAGKSTLTEALLLEAQRIHEAGATHGKRGRPATVSDWMEMEQSRGISISSAAVQCRIDDVLVTVVDTPGHADFSEDTFRVLSAVDAVIMLIDAAKGVEAQTRQLFTACAARGLPVVTFVNKWDRPGLDALALLEEVEATTGLVPTPLLWPVGVAGELHGLLDVTTGAPLAVTRPQHAGERAVHTPVSHPDAERSWGAGWTSCLEEVALLRANGQVHDQELFVGHASTPVLFGAASLGIGIRTLLEVLRDLVPPPQPRRDVGGTPVALDAPFTGYVFKVQSGMNSAHRDRFAYVRTCSGRFDTAMTLQHPRTGRTLTAKYAQSVFGQRREALLEAWPGDVFGLVHGGQLQPGDTIRAVSSRAVYPGMPRFDPTSFVSVGPVDSSRHKQFHRGLELLDAEGTIQLMHSTARGPQNPVLGAVGVLQFEVAADRMEREYHCPVVVSPLPFTRALAVPGHAHEVVPAGRDREILTRSDGQDFLLVSDEHAARALRRRYPRLWETAGEGAPEAGPG